MEHRIDPRKNWRAAEKAPDDDGLAICEHSYDGGAVEFEGIADRLVGIDPIYRRASERAA